MNSIAGEALFTGAVGRFDCEKRGRAAYQSFSNQRPDRSRIRNAHASCSRLVGHKGLGRRMDAAWTFCNEPLTAGWGVTQLGVDGFALQGLHFSVEVNGDKLE